MAGLNTIFESWSLRYVKCFLKVVLSTHFNLFCISVNNNLDQELNKNVLDLLGTIQIDRRSRPGCIQIILNYN